MSLADLLERRGEKRGIAEGRAVGKAELIMELHKSGLLSNVEALKRLKRLAKAKERVSPVIARALKKLDK